jgi:hypothetical protein
MLLTFGDKMNKKIYDIVIIDSGVDNCVNEDGIYFSLNGFEIVQKYKSFTDNVGHGTAVYSIVKSHNPNVKCFHVKIFDKDS